jgi:hypothetical protein
MKHKNVLSRLLPSAQSYSSSSSSSCSSPPSNKTISLLFTTFSDNPLKFKFFLSTIKNWAGFIPAIQPVLFTTNLSSPLNALAESHCWLVVRDTQVNAFGIPFFKPMFRTAYSLRDVQLYGYANGDILFTLDLVQTLRAVIQRMPHENGTFIVGRRRRFRERRYCTDNTDTTNSDIWRPDRLDRIARNRSDTTLDKAYAVDYFFVSRDYPWHGIKNVVIARRLYDNYVVGRSMEMRVTSIEATKTLTALHQCGYIKDRNRRLKEEDYHYNKLLIGKFRYYLGNTDNTKLYTQYNERGSISTRKRRWSRYPKT